MANADGGPFRSSPVDLRERVELPSGLAVGADRLIHVVIRSDHTAAMGSRVLVFDRAGALRSGFDSTASGNPRCSERDIAVTPDRSTYVAAVWARRIRKF